VIEFVFALWLVPNILVILPVRGRKIDAPKPVGVKSHPYRCDENGNEISDLGLPDAAYLASITIADPFIAHDGIAHLSCWENPLEN